MPFTFWQELEVLGQVLAVAVVCGAALGAERKNRRHRAGIRTVTLICIGSAVLAMAGRMAGLHDEWSDAVRVDPTRLASYVIAGIGFLGAGPIIRRKLGPEGLTTASTIWVAAGIGVLAGLGWYVGAVVSTVVVLLVLRALVPVSAWMSGGLHERELTLTCPADELLIARIEHSLMGSGQVQDVQRQARDGSCELRFRYRGTHSDVADLLKLITDILTTAQALNPCEDPQQSHEEED